MTRRLAMLAAFGVLVLAAGSARADDQEKFQGTWKPEKAVRAGMEMPAEELAKMSIEFKGNKAHPKHGDQPEQEAEFKLDATKKPKTIDIDTPEGKKVQGIYEVDGDMLKICFAMEGERPTKFESAEGSKVMYLVLKRAKK
jgi:uncharacterized protein (TIGR03067 family)